MTKYIDILLLGNSQFCKAPAWSVQVGDFVCLPDGSKNKGKLMSVVATATDSEDGDFIKMLELQCGHPLPKVTEKYHPNRVYWEDEADEYSGTDA